MKTITKMLTKIVDKREHLTFINILNYLFALSNILIFEIAER